jgi:Ser/Thr protein kinase RdoA (MazF antagonist)
MNALTAAVGEYYAAGPSRVHWALLRDLINEVYLIEDSDHRCVLKMYRPHWRTAAEVSWEADLLCYLNDRNAPVIRPLPTLDGKLIAEFTVAGEARLAMLFEYVDGLAPSSPIPAPVYWELGNALGRTHNAAVGFRSRNRREPVGLAALVDRPVRLLARRLPGSQAAAEVILAAAFLRSELARLAADMTWLVCHNDVTMDNCLLVRDRVVLLDFDSGGPGWLATDLASVYAHGVEHAPEAWEAFRLGYEKARSLPVADLKALPYLALAQRLWAIGLALDSHPSWGAPLLDMTEPDRPDGPLRLWLAACGGLYGGLS